MTLPAVDFRKQHHQHAKSSKMQPHKAGQTNSKRLKFHSASCASSKAEDVFPKLDPSIPEQARRMEQRRRMISYGKNTVGYEEYLRQVPKEKRNRRSMETPTTPDHTLDIPNKRWQGQIKAWYVVECEQMASQISKGFYFNPRLAPSLFLFTTWENSSHSSFIHFLFMLCCCW